MNENPLHEQLDKIWGEKVAGLPPWVTSPSMSHTAGPGSNYHTYDLRTTAQTPERPFPDETITICYRDGRIWRDFGDEVQQVELPDMGGVAAEMDSVISDFVERCSKPR